MTQFSTTPEPSSGATATAVQRYAYIHLIFLCLVFVFLPTSHALCQALAKKKCFVVNHGIVLTDEQVVKWRAACAVTAAKGSKKKKGK